MGKLIVNKDMHTLSCFIGSLLLAALALRFFPKNQLDGLEDRVDLNSGNHKHLNEASPARWSFVTLVCGDALQTSCPFPFTGLEELVGVRSFIFT